MAPIGYAVIYKEFVVCVRDFDITISILEKYFIAKLYICKYETENKNMPYKENIFLNFYRLLDFFNIKLAEWEIDKNICFSNNNKLYTYHSLPNFVVLLRCILFFV